MDLALKLHDKALFILKKVMNDDSLCSESDAELSLLGLLSLNGILAKRQVMVGRRIADIVIYDLTGIPVAVVELKIKVTTERERRKAFDQVTSYADGLGGIQAIVAAIDSPKKYVGYFDGVYFCRIEDVLQFLVGQKNAKR